MARKIVLLDMDGTTFDIDTAFITKLKAMFPEVTPIPTEELHDYHIENLYPQEHRQKLNEVWKSPGLFGLCKPISGALEAVKELEKYNDVVICSTPRWDNPTCVDDKRELVARYLGENWIREKRLFLVDDKTMVSGHYLIDDKPKITGRKNPSWEHIIYDQPWNRSVNFQKRITWENWKQVLPELV